MVTLLYDVLLWSTRDDLEIKYTEIGVYKYEKSNIPKEKSYLQYKKNYIERRGKILELKNSRPGKLKDTLKDFEEILTREKLVNAGWYDGNTYQAFFASGVIVSLTSEETAVLFSLSIDKTLVGKLTENVTDVAISRSHVIYSFNDNHITLVYWSKPAVVCGSSSSTSPKFHNQDPKVANCDGIGPPGRRFERKVTINLTEKLIAVWWQTGKDEVYPWSPINSEKDRSNFFVYDLNCVEISLRCYCRTELSPVSIKFSSVRDNILLTVEQGFDNVGGVTVLGCVYEVDKGTLKRISVTSIPLEAPLTAYSYNPSETCLLLACNNGVLALHCQSRGTTHVTKASLIPTSIIWLSSGTVLALINDRGQMQFFDLALSLLRTQLLREEGSPQRVLDLSEFFTYAPMIDFVKWATSPPYSNCPKSRGYFDRSSSLPFIMIHYKNGPLACLKFNVENKRNFSTNFSGDVISNSKPLSPDVLTHHYIKHSQVDEAINLLVSLNWETDGPTALKCLFNTVNHLLKLPLNNQRESHIEAALSSFLLPPVRFSVAVEDKFGSSVRALTRRFFFKLLREKCIEKAYRLAIDLKDHDCFLHVHHVARSHGNENLSRLALQSAREIGSSCHSCSCSNSSASSNTSFYSDSTGSSDDSRSTSSCSTCSSTSDTEHLNDERFKDEIRINIDDNVGNYQDAIVHNLSNGLERHTFVGDSQLTENEVDYSASNYLKQPLINEVGNRINDYGNKQERSDLKKSILKITDNKKFKKSTENISQNRFKDPINSGFLPGHHLLKPNIGSAAPPRLKTVREVCEASQSDCSDILTLNDDILIDVNAQKKALMEQYEKIVYQDIATTDDDESTVKVVHFGVV